MHNISNIFKIPHKCTSWLINLSEKKIIKKDSKASGRLPIIFNYSNCWLETPFLQFISVFIYIWPFNIILIYNLSLNLLPDTSGKIILLRPIQCQAIIRIEMEMSSFCNCVTCHFDTFWSPVASNEKLPVQPEMTILSRWQHFYFGVNQCWFIMVKMT